MNFFTHTFQRFQLDFKLLFIVLFLGIISWKGASLFSGGGGVILQMGSFIWGVCPMGGISFDGFHDSVSHETHHHKLLSMQSCTLGQWNCAESEGSQFKTSCMVSQLLDLLNLLIKLQAKLEKTCEKRNVTNHL